MSGDSVLLTSQKNSVPCQPSGRRVIPSGRSSVHCSIRLDDMPYRPDVRQTKHHSSEQRGFPSGPLTVSRSFCSSFHPSGSLSSPSRKPLSRSSFRFFPKFKYGKITSTVWTMWYTVRTRVSLRQVRNSNSIVQTTVCHGPDAPSSDMEIAC
jgi:hypothetical protein